MHCKALKDRERVLACRSSPGAQGRQEMLAVSIFICREEVQLAHFSLVVYTTKLFFLKLSGPPPAEAPWYLLSFLLKTRVPA